MKYFPIEVCIEAIEYYSKIDCGGGNTNSLFYSVSQGLLIDVLVDILLRDSNGSWGFEEMCNLNLNESSFPEEFYLLSNLIFGQSI